MKTLAPDDRHCEECPRGTPEPSEIVFQRVGTTEPAIYVQLCLDHYDGWKKRQAPLAPRVVADLLVIACLIAAGVFARAFAEGGLAIAGTEIPWSAIINGTISLLTAGLALALRKDMGKMHVTVNSKMDKLLEVVALKARAEGVLEEKERTAAAALIRAQGVTEGKGMTP